MKKLLFTLLISVSAICANAADGDTTKLTFQVNKDLKCYAGGERNNVWAAFSQSGKSYKKAIMKITLGCGSQECCVWDYLFNAFIMKKTGIIDSSFVKNDTVSFSPLVIVPVYKKFERINDYELGRLITPYGANSGNYGLVPGVKIPYVFDVTDYLPLLQDSFGVGVVTGGWDNAPRAFSATTEIFLVEGPITKKPKQVFRVYNGTYGHPNTIAFDTATKPLTVTIGNDIEAAKFRVTITGHGAHGEFTPQSYYVKVNGVKVYEHMLWKTDCDKTLVAPQAGTWVFSRANWCPGESVPAHEWDLTPYIKKGQPLTVDIDMEDFTPSKEANYQIFADLITYSANVNRDISLEEIISPNGDKRFSNMNPICAYPKVRIKNEGLTAARVAYIDYWVDPAKKSTYKWTGNLATGESAEVTMPTIPWDGVDMTAPTFHAQLQKTYHNTDNADNDKLSVGFNPPAVLSGEAFKFEYRTTNKGSENSYIVRNDIGDTVINKKNFTANTTYNDDWTLPEGCYTLEFTDYDPDIECGDGLSFWFSTQQLGKSSGYLRLKSTSGTILKSFNPDFGGRVVYHFSTNSKKLNEYITAATYNYKDYSAVEEITTDLSFVVYPNPASDFVYFTTTAKGGSIVRLKDVMGNNILVERVAEGKETQSINVDDLCDGVYFLELENNKKVMVRRIIVQH